MAREKTVRDPIHGDIPLDELMLELVDSAPVQRLRHIRQNGLCYLVYPAMTSSRFEHVLGAMHLGGRIAAALGLAPRQRQALKAACLLHDIGHGPFSHTSDPVMARRGESHEQRSAALICRQPLAGILERHGLDPHVVAGLVRGEEDLGPLVSSEIDVDKMDYLNRDAHYAGVAYGTIDLNRLLSSLKLRRGQLVVADGGLEAVESLLISRSLMYSAVYRHHTKRIAEAMLSRAVEELLTEKGVTYETVVAGDDIDLVGRLRASAGYPHEMMAALDARRLFKCVWSERLLNVTLAFRDELTSNRADIEAAIAADLGIPAGFVLLDVPEAKLQEYQAKVETPDGLAHIDEVSPLARALEGAECERLTVELYAAPQHVAKFRDFKAERYVELAQTRLGTFS